MIGRRKIVSMLILLMVTGGGVHARRSHHGHSGNKRNHVHAHQSRKKHGHKDNRPVMTVEDIKDIDHLWGIDISHYQSRIDWTAMQTEKPNFMFIKASEGIDIHDDKYDSNYAEAKKLGIPVGSYHFFSYKSPGKEQAANFLAVAQHKDGDLLPVLDAEYTKSMPRDRSKITAEISDFVNTIYDKLGFYPIIYCNYRYYQTYLTEAIQAKCKFWIVDYKNQPSCNWTFWQFTDRFKLTAIKGHVDLNFMNKQNNKLEDLFYRQTPPQNKQVF